MKKFSAQFKKQSESIRMRASEKNALRERLVSYMEYHPLPAEVAKTSPQKQKVTGIISEPFKVITFNKLYVRSFAGLFAAFLIMVVPAIAEKAVPGDVLYPVKVQFNEEVRSSLAFTPYAKVVWETQRLERRISEARLLASEGKLTGEAETQVALAVKNHSDAAQRGIAELRESDSDEAAIAEIAFASALAVQSEVLAGHIEKDEIENDGTENEDEGRSVVALAQVVDQARSSAEAAQTGVQPSYEKLLARIETESTLVYELFESVKRGASTEEIQNVERRLADIQRKVSEAIALKEGTQPVDEPELTIATLSMVEQTLDTDESTNAEPESGSNSSSTDETIVPVEEETVMTASSTSDVVQNKVEAVIMLRSALTDIQKLLNYLTHIDVRQSVSIETLLPITPTTAEKVSEISRLFNETRDLQLGIESRKIDSRLQEKTSIGQTQLDAKLIEVIAAMKKGNVVSALSLVEEAYVIATDLDVLTKTASIKPGEVVKPVMSATSTEEVDSEEN